VIAELARTSKADIGIVPSEPAPDSVISTLNESSDIIRDPAAGEKTDLLDRKLLFGPKCGAAPPGWPTSVRVNVGCSMTAMGGRDDSPPPIVYPPSLKRRPNGVSSGKAVWQAAQGCPV